MPRPKGLKHSEETKAKIGKNSGASRKGMPLSEKHKDSLRKKMKEVMASPIVRNKISSTMKIISVGENNPAWRGGISYGKYCQKFNNDFRERVRNFFDNRCVECGKQSINKRLAVHHVNFDKTSCCNDIKPIFVALCNSCHSKTNTNREYWGRHFIEIVENKYGGKCYIEKS